MRECHNSYRHFPKTLDDSRRIRERCTTWPRVVKTRTCWKEKPKSEIKKSHKVLSSTPFREKWWQLKKSWKTNSYYFLQHETSWQPGITWNKFSLRPVKCHMFKYLTVMSSTSGDENLAVSFRKTLILDENARR